MPYRKLEPNHTHVIKGTWSTKEVSIDRRPLTLEIVAERMRDWYDVTADDIPGFAWGVDAHPRSLHALAYGCTEFTVPETWVHHFASHRALDEFFTDLLKFRAPEDFTLVCTDMELRSAIRRIKRQWTLKVRKMQMRLL